MSQNALHHPRSIIITSNDSAYIHMFRSELILELIKRNWRVFVVAPHSDRVPLLEALGARFIELPLSRGGLNPIEEYKTYRSFLKVFLDVKPEKILNYTIKPVLYGSLAAQRAGIPNIYSTITGLGYVFTHNTFKHKLLQVYAIWLYRRALASNQMVFFQNRTDMQLFLDRGIVKMEQATLLNGSGVNIGRFDPSLFPPTPELQMDRSTGKVRFLLVARLLKDKGIGEYIESARLLRQKYPGATFQILGAPHENPRSYGVADIDAWKKEGVVDYLGEAKDVRPFLAAADVFVLPSYREGLSVSIMEAMAMGKAIITTDVPGCRETVTPGVNGWLVPAGTVGPLVEALEKMIQKPEKIEAMGLESRKMAITKFDVNKVMEQILKAVLEEV